MYVCAVVNLLRKWYTGAERINEPKGMFVTDRQQLNRKGISNECISY